MLTHAVIDALLGAAGLGDIGAHFPDTDERWRDADSLELLREVRGPARRARLGAGTWTPMVMCEAPKLGAHRDAMRARLAEAVGLAAADVNVKFTTDEGMGFVGRGEGIAALATGRSRAARLIGVQSRAMDRDELAFAGVAAWRELVRDGQVSSRELVELYLDRIERLDPALNASAIVMAERALADAGQADARAARRRRARRCWACRWR